MKLKLSNNVTKAVTIIENLVDLHTSAYNYVFDLALPEGLDSGEYNYELMTDDLKPLATGLCQIGNYVPRKTTYTAQTPTTYVQYGG